MDYTNVNLIIPFSKEEKTTICKHLKMLTNEDGFKTGHVHILINPIESKMIFEFHIKEVLYSKIKKERTTIEHVKYLIIDIADKISDNTHIAMMFDHHNISNLYNFFRLSTGNKVYFKIWFNNSCDMFKELHLIDQELFLSDNKNNETAIHFGVYRETSPYCRGISTSSTEFSYEGDKIEVIKKGETHLTGNTGEVEV